jgi:hypothetical protein
LIGDARPTDKPSYRDRFGAPFEPLRDETFQWLKEQDLAVVAFILGGFDPQTGHGALLIAPKNAGFFIEQTAYTRCSRTTARSLPIGQTDP